MSPPSNGPAASIGDAVTLWTRPRTDLILIFGHGVYADHHNVNGRMCPVIVLDNKAEVVVHYDTVWIGRKDSVAATLQRNKGVHVREWDLQKYLNGQLPEVDDLPSSSGGADEPAPRTATDKLMQLRSRIELSAKKVEMYKKGISEEEALITKYKTEMASMRATIMQELDAIEKLGIVPTPATAAPVVQVQPVLDEDAFRNAADAAAAED